MDFSKLSCEEFVEALASSAPAPGGGGASALVAAIGVALGNMVGSLTVGKKRYADVEDEMRSLKARSSDIQRDLLSLIAKDAEVFEPLSKAYGLPKDTAEQRDHKEKIMEEATVLACSVPMAIMEKCCEAIDIIAEFGAKGSRLAVSDAGCGAACCKAALMSASLNVFINTKAMQNRAVADELNARAEAMLAQYCARADAIFADVRSNF